MEKNILQYNVWTSFKFQTLIKQNLEGLNLTAAPLSLQKGMKKN